MKSVYCLGIASSPRLHGNTTVLLESALEGAKKAGARTELLSLSKYNFSSCRACEGCSRDGNCVIHDDMQEIYFKLLAADRLILAAPIFSMGICAQAKALVDRTQRFWATKFVLQREVVPNLHSRPERKGIFVSTAGSDVQNAFEGALQVARYFFYVLEMQYTGCYCYNRINEQGAILNYPDKLKEVYQAGFRLGS